RTDGRVGIVPVVTPRGDEELRAHPDFARPRKQARADERPDLRGDAHHRRCRKRVKPAATLDVRDARRLGRDQSIAETELLAERDPFMLLDDERVGTAVDREPVDLFAENDAAGTRAVLEKDEGDAAPR